MAGPRPEARGWIQDTLSLFFPLASNHAVHVGACPGSEFESEKERERERERGLGRVGNRQPGKAKLPLGAARFVSSACVVWCGLGAWAGGRTDVLIAFCIVGRAKSATHARSTGGCLPVCLRACESLGLRRSGRGRARAASLQHDAVRLGPRGTGQRI